MNTASRASTKLLISEAKTLDTFDIISPLVETSSSTATIESTTAQISSKSSSPFNTVAFKDSPKFSPLSETTILSSDITAATDFAADTNTNNFLKSPISPGTKSTRTTPTDNPLLPFLNEAYQNTPQPRENNGQKRFENMLASTSGNANQQPPTSISSGGTTSLLIGNASSPTNSIKNIKCEPYSTLSPLNDSVNSQNVLDETPSNNSNNGVGSNNNATLDSVKRERDCSTTSTSMMRQNSNGSIKSCANNANASSPNNGSDHSNSSNISSHLSQTIDNGTTDILQELSNSEKSGNKKKVNLNNLSVVKEEDNGVKSTLDKGGNGMTGSSNKNNLLCTTPTLNSLSSVKEENDVMNNLINVKKEEGNVSPDMSPAGFGSIANLSGSSSMEAGVRSCTPVKLDEVANTKVINNNSNSNSANNNNNNNNNEKLVSVLGSISNNGPNGCTDESLSASGPASSLVNTPSESCIGSTHHSAVNLLNNSNNTGGPIANCMEYMQQQNHIFVFSTQLANKGAESVLSGQFPTIIAYHCTQPATKNFLEDFFIKNPMKISKLQRQNTLNLCNISVGAGGQQWVGGCNPVSKMSHKPNVNKMNFTGLNATLENKVPLRPPNMSGFADAADALGSNDSDLMCWEQSRNNLEGTPNEGHAGLKMSNGVDGVGGASHVAVGGPHITNKPLGGPDAGAGSDNSTPSLQGIKVPDENLTPQQRQHREEQLAKLKQIDQFLSNPLQGANQLGKLGNDAVQGNLAGLMLNMPGSGPSGMASQIGNALNPNIRNIPPNVMNQNNQSVCNAESVPSPLGDGSITSQEMLSAHEMNSMACNTNKGPCNTNIAMGNQTNMSCGPNGTIGSVAPNVTVGNMPGNTLPCHGVGTSVGGGGNGNISGPGGVMPNSPEMMGHFNQNCGIGDGTLNSSTVKVMGPGGIHSQDIGQVGMAQMEWSKLQHQFFEERIKSTKPQGPNDIGCLSATLCRSNSTSMGNVNLRPMGGTCVSTTTTNSSQTIRSSQGPPPPYHPTQRSASVPIATQSPNPASPNNPTSNLSLPSPRTSGALGIPANSPNMDVHVSTLSTTLATSVVTTTSAVSTTISNVNAQGKGNFQTEGSPTNSGNNNITAPANNRNRNNQMNQFNSNPSTPLSHLSPKDLESFHTNVPGDLKNARPSPQRARTPLMAPNSGNITETGSIEGRFPSASPGLNFPSHMPNAGSGSINNYKGSNAVERQNSGPVPQFCRRTDNLPLNPNSNRSTQNKLNHSFDPISSLAQMSQQLTSCVSLNAAGVGSSAAVGNMGVLGVNDVNVPNNVNQNMESMMGSIDSSIDHCNASSSSNMGLPPHMSGPGTFIPNNCHINSMLGPMGHRLLNPKMCSGFNPANGGLGRDGPAGLHGVMPTHRMMGRMAMNFGNFNVSPNIQVKASTPNTIQYMPVRTQNNSNSNMRVPPSLDFLRYANPQISGAGNIMDNSHLGQGNAGGPTDPSKIGNCNNGPGAVGNAGMNFFGNCNQMGSLVGEQDEMVGGNLIPVHDLNMGAHPPMIRGMRPIRQQHLGHSGNQMVPGPRMQTPGGLPNMGAVGPMMPGHFANTPQDPMECGDSAMFMGNNPTGNGPITGQGQIYPGGNGQQKPVKSVGVNSICQNINTSNVASSGQMPTNANLLANEHNSQMQSAVNGSMIMGTNSNLLSNAMQGGNSASPVTCGSNGGNGANSAGDVGNVSYKPFVGPAANDLKYAQQYHSFQQQLYATSTRSQNTGNTNIGNSLATNTTFFVNK